MTTCIWCSATLHVEAHVVEECDCHTSEEVTEEWQDCDTGAQYLVTYPKKQDPVQIGAQGNKARREDFFIRVV